MLVWLFSDECSYLLSKFLLYLWVYAPYPEEETGTLLLLHANLAQASPGSESEANYDAYLREAVLKTIGPDDFILRLCREMLRPDISEKRWGMCLLVLHDLERLPEFLPYIQKHSVLDVVVEAMDSHCSTGDPPLRLAAYNHTSHFLR